MQRWLLHMHCYPICAPTWKALSLLKCIISILPSSFNLIFKSFFFNYCIVDKLSMLEHWAFRVPAVSNNVLKLNALRISQINDITLCGRIGICTILLSIEGPVVRFFRVFCILLLSLPWMETFYRMAFLLLKGLSILYQPLGSIKWNPTALLLIKKRI